MVNKLPPEDGGGAGVPKPELELGAPNGFAEPNPEDGSPVFGVAGEAGWDPLNMNELLPPMTGAGVEEGPNANDEVGPNVEGLLGAEPFCDPPKGFEGAGLFDGAPNENVGPGPVLDEDELPNEKDPVVDGLGGSFSTARPKENGEDVACDCPILSKGLFTACLSSAFIPPKGLEAPAD